MKKKLALLAVVGCLIVGIIGLIFLVTSRVEPYTLDEVYAINRLDTKIVIENERFFPIGMYHVSWASTKEELNQALERTASAGFNIMHPALDLDDDDFINRAEELGVKLIIEPNDDSGPLAMYQHFSAYSTIIGWLIADDFNSPARDHTVQSVQEQHDVMKRIASNKYTYMSGSTNNLDSWGDVSDIIGIQTYSVPSDPISTTELLLKRAINETQDSNVSIFANIQSGSIGGKRPPTPAEVRNMTYQALVSGVDGILFYTYFDPVWNIESDPQLWSELSSLAQEIQILSPILLNGDLRQINIEYPNVILGEWKLDNVVTYVVINMNEYDIEDAQIPIPLDTNINIELQSAFINQIQDLELNDHTISGNLESLGVYVYQVILK